MDATVVSGWCTLAGHRSQLSQASDGKIDSPVRKVWFRCTKIEVLPQRTGVCVLRYDGCTMLDVMDIAMPVCHLVELSTLETPLQPEPSSPGPLAEQKIACNHEWHSH